MAAVVPNPSLSGSCSWTANGNPITGSPATTTIVKGAIPGGVSLANGYGRCSINNGALPTSSYVYGGNSWPDNGYTGLSEQVYNDVKTNVNCISNQISCPALRVIESLSSCDGEEQLNTLCPGTDWENIIWIGPVYSGSNIPAGCYYITSFNGDFNINNDPSGRYYKINGGSNRTGQTSLSTINNIAKIDNGYYLYNSHTGWSNTPSLTAGTPYCQDKVENLLCSGVPSQAATNSTVTPSVTCRSGNTPTNISYTNAPSNWSSVAAGTYNNITVSASCSGTAFNNISCGSMTVSTPTTVNIERRGDSENINLNQGVTLNAGTLYIVGNIASGGVVNCYKSTADTRALVNGVIANLNGDTGNSSQIWFDSPKANDLITVNTGSLTACKTTW